MKKLTIEYVKEYVEGFGYKCISDVYIGSKIEKLEFQCPSGHVYKARWSCFQSGKRCPICYGNKKKTIEEIRQHVEEYGYRCLSEKYVSCKKKLEFLCDKGHIYKARRSYFQSGRRCPICSNNKHKEKMTGENHPNWRNYSDEDRKNFESYKAEVTQVTNINYIKYFYFINPSKLERGKSKYHLDHIYSVIDGFNNHVPPNIIANPYNLKVITYTENMSKQGDSHMTIEQLYIFYICFLLKQKMEGT